MSAKAKPLPAPQCWNKRFISFTEKAGLKKSASDRHLFYYIHGDSIVYIATYDGDGLVGNKQKVRYS
jgi:hypothetical protein